MRPAPPGTVDPLKRPLDPVWRQRYINGSDPLARFRGGLSRAAWRALTNEDRARVLDTTAPLPEGTPRPDPAMPAPAPTAASSTRTTSVLLCHGCGTYFPTRHGRRLLAWCRTTAACQPGTGRGRRRSRRRKAELAEATAWAHV
ncbi:hypothetical protein ACWEOW_13400 [Monashia sp. NPDC004114]